jgi:hypothetical protein
MIDKTLTFNSREEFREYAKNVLKEELENMILEAEEEAEDSPDQEEIILKKYLARVASNLAGNPQYVLSGKVLDDVYKTLKPAEKEKILSSSAEDKFPNITRIEKLLGNKVPVRTQISPEAPKELTFAQKRGMEGLMSAFLDPGSGYKPSTGGGETWNPYKGFLKRNIKLFKDLSYKFGGNPYEWADILRVVTDPESQYYGRPVSKPSSQNFKKFLKWKELAKKVAEYNEKNPETPKKMPEPPEFLEYISGYVNIPVGEFVDPKLNILSPGYSDTPSEERVVPFSSKQKMFTGRAELAKAEPPDLSRIVYPKLRTDISGAPELAKEIFAKDKKQAISAVADALIKDGIKKSELRRKFAVKDISDVSNDEDFETRISDYVERVDQMIGTEVIDLVIQLPELLNDRYDSFSDFIKKYFTKQSRIEEFLSGYKPTKEFTVMEMDPILDPTKEIPEEEEEEDLRAYPSQKEVGERMKLTQPYISNIEDIGMSKIDNLRNLSFFKIVDRNKGKFADLVTKFIIDNDEKLSFPETATDEEIGEINKEVFNKFLDMLIDKDFVGQYIPTILSEIPPFKGKKPFKDPKSVIKSLYLNMEDLLRNIGSIQELPAGKTPKTVGELFAFLMTNSDVAEIVVKEYAAVKDLYDFALARATDIKNIYQEIDDDASVAADEDSVHSELIKDLMEGDIEANYKERLADVILGYLQKGEQGLYGFREKLQTDLESFLKPKTEKEARTTATQRERTRDELLGLKQAKVRSERSDAGKGTR